MRVSGMINRSPQLLERAGESGRVGRVLVVGLAKTRPTLQKSGNSSLVTDGFIVEQSADRFVPVNPLDGIGDERGNRDHFHVGQMFFGNQWNAVGYRYLIDRGAFQFFYGLPAEHAVGRADVYALGTGTFGHIGCPDGCAGCGDHVVVDDCNLSFERCADEVVVLDFGSARSPLVDNGNSAPHIFLEIEGLFDAPFIRAEDDQFVLRDIQSANVLGNFLDSEEVIHGDIEEALDLRGMKVECQDAVGPRFGNEVGDQLRGNRDAAFVLAVLAGITVVGQHGGDSRGARALERIQHDQQFHQVLIDGCASWLNDEDIPPANVFIDRYARFAIGEVGESNCPQRDAAVLRNAFRQRPVRPTTEDFELVVVSVPEHRRSSCRTWLMCIMQTSYTNCHESVFRLCCRNKARNSVVVKNASRSATCFSQ
jgi:hypothetical protein